MKQLNLHSKQKLEELEALGGLPLLEQPYTVPENYFADLDGSRMLSKIRDEEFIDSLPTQNVFEVEEAYFDNFTVKVSQQAPAKLSISWWKPAAAVASIALVCFGVWNMLPHTNSTAGTTQPLAMETQAKNSAATLPEQIEAVQIEDITPEEAKQYVVQNIDEFDAVTAELEKTTSSTNAIEKAKPVETKSAEAILDEVSPEEINEYLNQEDIEEVL
jgi:hypothetical protein